MVDFTDTKFSMQKTLDHLQVEISAIRTGRATPALIENVICAVYQGTQNLRVKELASINVSDPQTIIIQPWDGSIIGEIKNGILAANVGLTPVVDGAFIRVSVPALTTERRLEYVKLLHQKAEEARVALRNVRRDKMVTIKNAFEEKKLSEDEKFKAEQDLQKVTDEYVEKVTQMEKRKEMEILQI